VSITRQDGGNGREKVCDFCPADSSASVLLLNLICCSSLLHLLLSALVTRTDKEVASGSHKLRGGTKPSQARASALVLIALEVLLLLTTGFTDARDAVDDTGSSACVPVFLVSDGADSASCCGG
jgi:hypothetical protein